MKGKALGYSGYLRGLWRSDAGASVSCARKCLNLEKSKSSLVLTHGIGSDRDSWLP